ncbi:EAL domain-containing protein [Bacillus timonensis]|nr:EAL domain-containing protein [Bacillus timonensis]
MKYYGCTNCGILQRIDNEGYISLTEFESHERESISTLLQHHDLSNEGYQTIKIAYYSKTQLQSITTNMIQLLNSDTNVLAAVHTEKSNSFLQWLPILQLHERIVNEKVVSFIQSGSLVSYLQPIINLHNGKLYGYESLLRAENLNEQIAPSTLFKIATDAGMHSLLDRRARETAIKSRINNIPKGIKSFINFLPSTIYNPEHCLKHTFEIVKKYKVDPEDLVFEVVETEQITDIEHLKRVLDVYKASGMKVALDDVGSGFATLEMLTELQPDFVKVDRHYIDHCDQSIEKQQFLQDVVDISKQLKINILGEGIEREEELEYCRSIGIHHAQGYFIGKPSINPSLISTNRKVLI